MPRSDLAVSAGSDILEFLRWILPQISRVHIKTMNMVLTANPITVMTRLSPGEIIDSYRSSTTLLPASQGRHGNKGSAFSSKLPRFPEITPHEIFAKHWSQKTESWIGTPGGGRWEKLRQGWGRSIRCRRGDLRREATNEELTLTVTSICNPTLPNILFSLNGY